MLLVGFKFGIDLGDIHGLGVYKNMGIKYGRISAVDLGTIS